MTDALAAAPADPRRRDPIHLEGTRKEALDVGRNRLLVTGAVLAMVYLIIAGRLVDLTVFGPAPQPRVADADTAPGADARTRPIGGRANIVDRNGIILAASLPTVSLYADPGEILDAGEAAGALARVLPDLGRDRLFEKLTAKSGFVWLRRNLTPRQQQEIIRLGLPGLHFRRAFRRVYPHGTEAGHLLGLTDVDGRGIAGLELAFDRRLESGAKDLRLTIDLRIQAILHKEMSQVMDTFHAKGAVAIVSEADNGEILGLVSLPRFDPNDPDAAKDVARFNRATKGVYEMGSTFKLFTAAMALDAGVVKITDRYDVSKPIRVARFTIDDYHGKRRWLSVPEILIYSSNIGAAKMAVDVGARMQRNYLEHLGLLRPAAIELPEVGTPLTPTVWREINTMTIAYGHGIAVSPVQMSAAVAAVVNGGIFYAPTLIKRASDHLIPGERVFAPRTSRQMRHLMRQVVTIGTGSKADIPEYRVGGKTGTAEKLAAGGYQHDLLVSSFVSAFPIDRPRYVVLVLVDEPKGNPATLGFATGGWVAAPSTARIIRRIGALLGLLPEPDATPAPPMNPLLVNAVHGPAAPREPALAPR